MKKQLKTFIPVLAFFLLLSACTPNKASPTLDITEVAEDVTGVPTVSFVSFGDWGTGLKDQVDVAQAIGRYCGPEPCEFILALGDNFYPSGVQSTTDPLWQTSYHDVYDFLNLPFYVVSGNHDYAGSIQAQIDYSSIDDNWNFPSLMYSFTKPDGLDPPLVEFFVIAPDFFDETAQEWLKNAIQESRATWKILATHYPFITNRNVPESDNPPLEKIVCNKMDLILAGHNHLFSFLRGDKDGCWIEQIILGTGGAQLQEQSMDRDEGRLITTASVHGFGWFQISREKIIFRMISSDSTLVYNITWNK